MSNDIHDWQDLQRQEGFLNFCRSRVRELKGLHCLTDKDELKSWQETRDNAKRDYKRMFKEYESKYINN